MPAGASAGSRTIAAVGSAPDDRVAALERRLGPERGERAAVAASDVAAVARRSWTTRGARSPEGVHRGASRGRDGRAGRGAAALPVAPRPRCAAASRSPTTRAARSSSRPARSRDAASCARGPSRSSARRSASSSRRADAHPPAATPPRRAGRAWPTDAATSSRSGTTSSAAATGRGCADVRGEVGERDVDLVAHAAHDRHRVRDHRAHDPLVVERPQVLERAAAAGEDRHGRRLVRAAVSRRARRSSAPAAGTRSRCYAGAPVALDLARDEHDAGHRPAAREHRAHVAPDGAGRRGDRPRSSAAAPGSGRLRAASNRPSVGEPRLELLEPDREVAEPRRLERLDVELERALRLEHVDPPVGDDLEPGLGLERRARRGRRGTTRTGAARGRP